MVKVINTKK